MHFQRRKMRRACRWALGLVVGLLSLAAAAMVARWLS